MMDIQQFISYERQYRERCKSFKKYSYGEANKGKKFRVLCNKNRQADKHGLISTVLVMLPNMIEARKHGYIPVVDLKRNSRSQLAIQERCLAKKENAWEYYFTQPDKNISLEEVRQSRFVEEQVKDCRVDDYYMSDECPVGNKKAEYLSKAIRQNIHLQTEIKKKVLVAKENLFLQTGKVLGVGIRAEYRFGILSNISHFNGHPLVGSCVDCIRAIEEKLKEWHYDSFFLMIDDRQYLEAIKKYFGENCIYLKRPRIHCFADAMRDIPQPLDMDRLSEFEGLTVRNRNEDYLVELYLLAQCDSLYASRGTGHNFSYLLNNGKYRHTEFGNLGEFQYKK